MEKGNYIRTPRFSVVRIKEVYGSKEEAQAAGFTETTHYQDSEWVVVGHSIDLYHMEFAAYRKEGAS